MSSRAQATLKALFGLALLGWLVSTVSPTELTRLSAGGDTVHLLLGALGLLVGFGGFQAWRLHVLVRRYTGGVSNSAKLFFIGAFFNNLLPSNVGGDAVRLVYLHRARPGSWTAPLTLLMLHRLSGLAVLLAAAALYALLLPGRLAAILSRQQLGIDAGSILWLLPVVVVLGLLLLSPPGRRLRALLGNMLAEAGRALAELSLADFVWLLLLTCCFHLSRLVGFHFLLTYFQQSVALIDLVPVLAVVAVVALLPVTIGGLGLMEGTIALSLVALSVPATAGVAVALVNRVVLLTLALVGGVLYALNRDELVAAAQPSGSEGGSLDSVTR